MTRLFLLSLLLTTAALAGDTLGGSAFRPNTSPSGAALGDSAFRVHRNGSNEPLLPSSLALASGTYSATARFEGTDAAAGGWPAKVGSTTLSLTGAGADPTYSVATPFSLPTAVDFNTGKSFAAPNNTFSAVAAGQDLVLEAVFKYVSNGAEQAVVGKYVGWLLVAGTASDQLIYYGAGTLTQTPGVTNNTWYHVLIFVDRNGNQRLYRNGTALINGAVSGVAMDSAVPFTIGSYAGGASGRSNHLIALVQTWVLASGSVGDAANCDAVATTRYAAAQARGFVP